MVVRENIACNQGIECTKEHHSTACAEHVVVTLDHVVGKQVLGDFPGEVTYNADCCARCVADVILYIGAIAVRTSSVSNKTAIS